MLRNGALSCVVVVSLAFALVVNAERLRGCSSGDRPLTCCDVSSTIRHKLTHALEKFSDESFYFGMT